MPIDMDIPAEELREVATRVAAFATPHAVSAALGYVRLEADGIRRRWIAGDGQGFAHLGGGATDEVLRVSIPPSLLALPERLEDRTLTLTVPQRYADGRLDGPLQLAASGFTARRPPGPEGYPDWRAALDDALAAPTVEVVVDPGSLAFAVDAVAAVSQEAPQPGPSRCWLEADTDRLRVAVARPDGREERTISAGGDGEAAVIVERRPLRVLAGAVTGQELSLHLPTTPGQPLRTGESEWTAWINTVDGDAERRRLQARLGQVLDELAGSAAVTWDDEAAYRVGWDDATIECRVAAPEPPQVLVEAIVLEGVPKSRWLLDELNDVNTDAATARVFWAHDEVRAGVMLPAEDLDRSTLAWACRAVLTSRAELAPRLRLRAAKDAATATGLRDAGRASDNATRLTVEVDGEDLVFTADGSRVPPWPFGAETKVHVLSAYNPGGEAFSYHDNERAHAQLEAELRVAGHHLLPAALRAPDGSWRERAVAVFGLRTKEAATVARRYGQDVVYELTSEGVRVLDSTP